MRIFGGGQSGLEPKKKNLKISIFGVRSDADLIDFNRFGEVVSRRAGIIRLIDGWEGEVFGVHSTP